MKKRTTIALAVLVIILGGGFYFFNRNGSHSAHHVMLVEGETSADGAVKGFLEMMIPHHEEAVESSKVIMMDATITVPDVRLFAARIADAQEFEVGQMKTWYYDWFGQNYLFDPSMYNPMMSNLSEEEVGNDRAKKYLKEMIKHHEAAIKSSEDTRTFIEDLEKSAATTDGDITITNSHPGIDTTVDFAKKIEANQKKEIEDMEKLIDQL